MAWIDDVELNIDKIYDAAGVEVVFVDRDGTETLLTALVEYDLQQLGEEVQVMGATAIVSVRKCDITELPRRGDQFRIARKYYTVDRTLTSDEIEHRSLVA